MPHVTTLNAGHNGLGDLPIGAYKFPPTLSVSDDVVIDTILADIPFFSIGLLAFGVFTFLLAMKRINILASYLYSSALVAFIAAILDLAQLLSRNITNGRNRDLDLRTVTPTIIIREIVLAISIGLRYLFFWTFVSFRSRAEVVSHNFPEKRNTSFLRSTNEASDNGNWLRWGIVGITVKWVLLASVVAIPILQIVWRVVENQRGPVYMAETTMEIVASSLFILRLLINASLSPNVSVSGTLREYLAPIAALLIGIGIAIGNIICFAFSESSLGRFLQAVELYVLILFILLYGFWNDRSPDKFCRSVGVKREYADKSFKGLSDWQTRQSIFHVNPPSVSTPEAVSPNSVQSQNRQSSIRYERRSRLSSWIFKIPHKRSPRHSANEISLDDPESVYSNEENDIQKAFNPYIEELKKGRNRREMDLVQNAEPKTSLLKPTQLPFQRQITPTQNSVDNKYLAVTGERSDDGATAISDPLPGLSLFSHYKERPSNIPYTTRATASPVYGLDGIRQSLNPDSQVQRRSRSSTSSFDELMRQQNELDKRIDALRLLTPGDPDKVFPFRDSVTTTREGRSDRRSRTRSVVVLSAGSGTSEFSLSVFPDPPEAVENDGRSTPVPEYSRADDDNLLPPRMPAVYDNDQRILSSITPKSLVSDGVDDQVTTRGAKFNSAGTQYDVTSFIGNLTSPEGTHPTNRPLSDVDSADGSSPSSSPSTIILTAERKPMRSFYRRDSPSFTQMPATASSGLENGFALQFPAPPPPMAVTQEALLSHQTAQPGMAPKALTMMGVTPITAARVKRQHKGVATGTGLPARTKLATNGLRPAISIPRPQSGRDVGSNAFEQPRPAPQKH